MISDFLTADKIPIIEIEDSPSQLDPYSIIIETLSNHAFEAKEEICTENCLLEFLSDDLEPLYWMQTALVRLDGVQQQIAAIKDLIKEKYDEEIKKRIEVNAWESGDFSITETIKQTPRKVDKELLLTTYQDVYATLLQAKASNLEETYTPTIKEVEALLGQRARAIIIPGQQVVTGYEIRPRWREQ